MNRLFAVYKKFLFKHPFTLQVAQTGIIMGSGDVICQTLIEHKRYSNYDVKRTLRFAVIGFCLVGPVITKWYGFLDKTLKNHKYVTVKKVVLDQTLMAPTIIASILTSLSLLEGKPIEQTKQFLKEDYFDILKTNYTVWPAVQMINFYFVPLYYQVLLVQMVAMCWNTYISWKTQT